MTHPTHINLPIDTGLFLEVARDAELRGASESPVELIHRFIKEGLSRGIAPTPAASLKGYYWKGVFLPDGTALRLQYNDIMHYASVVGDRISYNEKILKSPNEFTALSTRANLNAWKYLYLKRPSDAGWMPADALRRRVA